MPYKDPEAYREYQRNYQREYRQRKREADPEWWAAEQEKKRTEAAKALANARRRERWAADPEFRASGIARVRNRKRGRSLTPEGSLWGLTVLRRDPCSYCGAPADTLDHIDPHIDGHIGDPENLTAACFSCNASKGKRSLLLFLAARFS